MGATKMHLYKDHQIDMAKLCKALGHPARIAVVEKLFEEDNLNCTDLRYYIPKRGGPPNKYIIHRQNDLTWELQKDTG
jgi:hypothetical protein